MHLRPVTIGARERDMGKVTTAAIFVLFAGGLSMASADVRLPSIVGDNMVLQREMQAPIWGWASPGEAVTVTVARQRKTATAGADGRWTVRLDPMKAGGPFEMTVAGENLIRITNVLVGEVWIASGQSNMQMRVREVYDAEKEMASANYPRIRLFSVPHIVAHAPQNDVPGEWVECTPETVREFSAVQYFFGRKIHEDLGVPVGLIHDSWSGSLIEPWMTPETLEGIPEAKPLLAAWKKAVSMRGGREKAACEEFEKRSAAWREEYAKAAPGKRPPAPEADEPFDPLTNFQQPSGLYNGMIAPVVAYGIRGALWYQGEGNSERAVQYRAFFPALIADWRRLWGQGDFPFLFVQISSYRKPPAEPYESEWAELREAQAMTLRVPNTGMALSLDVGDANEPHYRNKQAVGTRLALVAEGIVYRKKVEYRGPMYESMAVEGSRIRIAFKYADGGLSARGGELKMFQIAGENRKFVWADAKIDGDTVLVWSDKVAQPAAVRYAWADNALAANLYNKAGLPASTFRTDDWPVSTQGVLVWSGLDRYK